MSFSTKDLYLNYLSVTTHLVLKTNFRPAGIKQHEKSGIDKRMNYNKKYYSNITQHECVCLFCTASTIKYVIERIRQNVAGQSLI